MTSTTLPVVSVNFNLPATIVDDNEVWRAACDELEASALQVGDMVLAVTEEPRQGFLARVVEAPVARGRRLDPHTGQSAQAYRVLVTRVGLAPLLEAKK